MQYAYYTRKQVFDKEVYKKNINFNRVYNTISSHKGKSIIERIYFGVV